MSVSIPSSVVLTVKWLFERYTQDCITIGPLFVMIFSFVHDRYVSTMWLLLLILVRSHGLRRWPQLPTVLWICLG